MPQVVPLFGWSRKCAKIVYYTGSSQWISDRVCVCADNANTTNSTIRVSHVPLNAGRKADRLTVLTLKWGNVVQYYRVSSLEGSVVCEAKSEGLQFAILLHWLQSVDLRSTVTTCSVLTMLTQATPLFECHMFHSIHS